MSARIRLVMNEYHHCLKYQQPNIYTRILSHFVSSMHNNTTCTTPYNYYNSAQTVNACTSCCMHCMYIIEAVVL